MLYSLNNLPQTIEETYELILLEIDQQDRSFARIIFLWVCGNDMLPGSDPIPVGTLLSVLKHHGLDSAISVSENCKGLIEEICSCMLTINVATLSCGEPGEKEVDTAKCAHYTVVEYLFSEQIKTSKASFFGLSNGDIVAEFVATTIAVAETVDLQDLESKYWESFPSYCSRAAWLSIFTWESDLTEHEALWMGLLRMWSNDLSYFSSADDLFRNDMHERLPELNASWLLIFDPEEAHRVQEFAPGILACLLLNSSHILANKLVSHYGTEILEVPFHFYIAPRKGYFGSIVEAVSMATMGYNDCKEALDAVKLLSHYFDNTQLAFICVGIHMRPDTDCECDAVNSCQPITMLLQYVQAGSDIHYCLTLLQLSVYCLDLRAVQALLDSGVDPNGIGTCDGRPTPIYLYKVDDRWWSASPLHMVRHAPFAAEEINETLDIMRSREAQRSEIEELLIQFGAEDFGLPSDTSTCTERSTVCEESSMGTQALSVRREPNSLDSFDETE